MGANTGGLHGGLRTRRAAEALANSLLTVSHVRRDCSVAPKTLTIVDTSDGIAQIEAWAARVGLLAPVRWNSISATAAAFKAAGGLPSRVNPAASGTAAQARPRRP